MIALVFIYVLLLLSAVRFESQFLLNSLLERVVAVFTLAAVLLVLLIQVLSLVGSLAGGPLLWAVLVVAAASMAASRLRPATAGRLSWRSLFTQWRMEAAGQKESWLVLGVLTLAGGLMVIYCVLGACMIPLDDIYHYEMPLFWIQNHSLGSFVASNPRINTTAFVDAAMVLPGYLYGRSGLMFAVVTLIAGILSLGIVVSLARKLGCSRLAAAGAGGLLLGFSIFALPFLTVSAASYLAGLWVGASLMFLMGCQGASGPLSKEQTARLGFSVLCFLMACGSKNTTVFLAPFYLVGLGLCLKRRLFGKRIVLVVAVAGALGLLGSGTAWNYIHSTLWYGNPQGPPYMRLLLSKELNLRSVWTRVARGATLMVFDVLWIPPSAREVYGTICQKTVRAAGGNMKLGEDEFFFDFDKERISTRSACGLVGMVFLVPAMFVGARRMAGLGGSAGKTIPAHRLNIGLLLLFGLGYFLMCHMFLRWQSIGLWRLMPAFPLLGAPLIGLVMERRACQAAALLVVALSSILFLTYDAGMMARRFATNTDSAFFKRLASLSKPHGFTVECQWNNEAPQELLVQEDYGSRKIPLAFMERVEPSTVIAFVGGANSTAYAFFGRDFSNQVVPLVDIRKPDQLLAPPDNAQYLVFGEDYKADASDRAWAVNHGYTLVFQVFKNHECVFMAFKQNPK